MNEFEYILRHLNGHKLGEKYVSALDANEYWQNIICLNCNQRGHQMTDCPNSCAFSETVEISEEKSMILPMTQGGHSRGITICELMTVADCDDEKTLDLVSESYPIELDDDEKTNIDQIRLHALRQNSINVQELTDLKQHYQKCLDDPTNADLLQINTIFKGDEVSRFQSVDVMETDQLQHAINAISARISKLKVQDLSNGHCPYSTITSSLKLEMESYSAVISDDKAIYLNTASIVNPKVINITVRCMCISANEMVLKMKRTDTLLKLKQNIIKECNLQNDLIQISEMKLFSDLECADLNKINAETLSVSQIAQNYHPMFYENDERKICDLKMDDDPLMFCVIDILMKIKILFPKNVLCQRIMTFGISTFDLDLLELYAHIESVTNVKFTDIMLYSPFLQRHIESNWSGERLIGKYLLNETGHEQIVLYFMQIPIAKSVRYKLKWTKVSNV